MGEFALRVDGLGKMYHLGGQASGYRTLGDQFRKLHPASLRVALRRGRRAESKPPFWALKDVSFEVKNGEAVGVIGRNGAGKSTLLKILSRITEPTEGNAAVRGRVGALLEVGTGFHPELTGRENIYLNGAILGMKRSDTARKFDEIVAFAEVGAFVDTAVKYYSSGMYTRLAFAVAAHLEPDILVVDEVLAVGDAQFQKKCLGRMGEVAKGGRTVLFVSHNMGAVQALCQSAILLAGGRVAEAGPAATVVPKYLNHDAGGVRFERPPDEGPDVRLTAAALEVTGDAPLLLRVTADVRSPRSVLVNLDLRVYDGTGAPVGLGAVGTFDHAQEVQLSPGVTRIVSVHDIGVLASGTYHLGIDVGDPAVGFFDRVDRCLVFEINSPPRPGCYRRLPQQWGYGAVELPYVGHDASPLLDEQPGPP